LLWAKQHRKLNITLGIVLVGVWGMVLENIVASFSATEEKSELGMSASTAHSLSAKRSYVYQKDVRDPFVPVERGRARSRLRALPVAVPWTPPPLKLTGVMITSRHRTAMVETANGMVAFMEEGDTLSGAKVLKIEPRSVTYTYMQKKNQWILEQR
jgi:type II secretory pathway component PulC